MTSVRHTASSPAPRALPAPRPHAGSSGHKARDLWRGFGAVTYACAAFYGQIPGAAAFGQSNVTNNGAYAPGAGLALAAAATGLCPRPQAGATALDPMVLRSRHGKLEVELEYLSGGNVTASAHADSDGDADAHPKFCYMAHHNIESPTLFVRAGDELVFRLHNGLSPALNITDGDYTGPIPNNFSTCAHQEKSIVATSTNVHFHGLSVPPTCKSDNVLHTIIGPGQSFTYRFYISNATTPGLYWYHPHIEGVTELALQGGAAGAIVVGGLEAEQPAVAGLRERVFVLRDYVFGTDADNSTVPAWDISINQVPVPWPAYPPAQVMMLANETQVWDVVNAAGDTIFDLQVVYDGVPQDLRVVALDGAVTRDGSNGQILAQIINKTDILLPAAARAQFMVTAPSPHIKNAQLVTQNVDTGPLGDTDPYRPIAQIVLGDDASPVPLRFPTISHASPAIYGVSAGALTKNRTLYFSEIVSDPLDPDSPTLFYITEQGATPALFSAFEPPAIVTKQGDVEDWTIQNRAGETHVFHMHQLHFLVTQRDEMPLPPQEQQFLDTITVPYWNGTGPYPSYTLRFDFRDSDVGQFVYHCHLAGHSDAGMMATIEVNAA